MPDEHAALNLDAQEAYLAMAHDLAAARMEVDGLRGEVAALADQLRRSRMELVYAIQADMSFIMALCGRREDSAHYRDLYLERWKEVIDSISDIAADE